MFEEFRHLPYWRERRWYRRPYYAYSRPVIVNDETSCDTNCANEYTQQQTDMMRMGLICFVIFMACVLILLARK
jgi:hypothetical protein